MTEVVETKEIKWTPDYTREYMRTYMRDRWRRVHNVKPEKFQEVRSGEKMKEAEKFGEGAVLFMKQMEQKEKEKKKREPLPKVACEVCHGLYMDTAGQLKQHERTKRHKLGLEIQQAKK